MLRRHFLAMTGLGVGGLVIPPVFGRRIAADELLIALDATMKKRLADAALTAATGAGASYCDVRIGRYLQQFVITRENQVENVVNTESTGVGVRVLVKGTWGFAATSDLSEKGVVGAARQAAAVATANATVQAEPVQLAKVRGVGQVSWATPISRMPWRSRSKRRSIF